MKGSLTVEASMVFPFCFIVIGLVCFFGIFLYDQAVLKLTGYECILQFVEQENINGESFQGNLQKQAGNMAEKRILGIEELQTSVKISASKIIVSYRGKQKLLNIPIETKVVYEKTFPELTLRLTRTK